jgi:formylglycine-generating enzyme required for sulfatase activity
LFINEELKGTVLKEEYLYLKLTPGTYRYTAKNPTTGDEWRDTFSIATGRPNEVFIDFMYAMDLENEKKAKVASNTIAPVAASAQKGAKPPVQKTEANKIVDKEKELAVINSLIGNMVLLKGGNFIMGNNRSPSADETEHAVTLNPFLFGKYEITQEQWESLMRYNPSLNKNCPACPVENVSWEEVMIFIRKLNSITNKKFRLPTEAEWEYVAKLGGKAEIDKAGGVEEYIKKTAWGSINSENKTHPVGKKQPNTSGIYDLTGNVSEWCMDWYGAFFFKEDFTEKNPEGPPLGKEKVIRGGNYKDYIGDRFRPSFRNKMNPKTKSSEVGFRLVMERQD